MAVCTQTWFQVSGADQVPKLGGGATYAPAEPKISTMENSLHQMLIST